MTVPFRLSDFLSGDTALGTQSPADLWDAKVAQGLSPDDATAFVSKVHGPPPPKQSVLNKALASALAPKDATALKSHVPPAPAPIAASAADAQALRSRIANASMNAGTAGRSWESADPANREATTKQIVADGMRAAGEGLMSGAKTAVRMAEPVVDLAASIPGIVKDYKAGDTQGAAGSLAMAALPFAIPGSGVAINALKDVAEAKPFYSRLARAIQSAPFEKGTAEQWAAALGKNVNAGEREWTGVDALLGENAGKVLTKDQVAQRFGDSQIKTGVKTLAEPPKTLRASVDARMQDLLRAQDAFTDNARQLGIGPAEALDASNDLRYSERSIPEIMREYGIPVTPRNTATAQAVRDANVAHTAASDARNAASERVSAPKFAQYTEPGGENYREKLITLDRPRQWLNGEPVTAEDLSTQGGREAADRVASFETPAFQSSHFSDPNILAHVRLKDRTLPNGEKALHVEEVQSDWHQQGRENGYRADERVGGKDDIEWMREGTKLEEAMRHATPDARPALEAQWFAAQSNEMQARQLRYANTKRVPDAPFKKTEDWSLLAMKHVIDEAAKGGYDRVVWTPGDLQAHRYREALLKAADNFTYDPKTSELTAYKDGFAVHSGNYDPRAIADVIGKTAADQLLKSPLRTEAHVLTDITDEAYPAHEHAAQVHHLAGNDLQVGGAGMRKFYDEMLPKQVKEHGKKLGVKIDIEHTPMLGRGRDQINQAMDANFTPDDEIANPVLHRQLQQEYNNAPAITTNFPSFKITPQLRQKILTDGQPLYAILAAAGLGGLAAQNQQPPR